MSEPLDQRNLPEEKETEIIVNEYGETRDPAVVVDEPDRTVLVTPDETIVIDKEPSIDVVPVNRPRKVYGGMWGPAELITAGLAMLALLAVVLIYAFVVVPTNRELEHNRNERDRLEADLMSAQQKYGSITNTETHVATLMSSVNDFEMRYLPVSSTGRASLYQRINGLIAGHGLINTSGPDYVPLETLENDDNSVKTDEERGRAKYQSLFPGVYVTMTVEGSYQNIRRFIREIETGGDFVVVSAVELEPSDTQQRSGSNPQNPAGTVGQQPGVNPAGNPSGFPGTQMPGATTSAPNAANKGKMHGEVVSLRLEMAAYFRRPNPTPPMTDVPQQ
jgi:hypothetical protein